MIRMGGFTLGMKGKGGIRGPADPETSGKRAEGLFDLIGLGGGFDSLLIAFVWKR